MSIENIRIHALILTTTGMVRSKTLLSILNDANVPFEIIQNGDVNDAMIEWKAKGSKSRPRKPLTNNERSCTFGHRSMYQRALGNTETFDYFLFLEDDARLDVVGIKTLISAQWNFKPNLILLGSCGGWVRRNQKNLTHDKNCYRVFMNSNLGTHAYLADKTGINSLLAGTQQLDVLADEFNCLPKIEMYVLVPYLAFQENFLHTTIPLPAQSTSRKFRRRFLSSIYDDMLDIKYLKRVGSRTMRLKELENVLTLFLKKIPGCNI